VLAGLGKMGKNTLVVNDRYGNMIWLGAVVTSMELVADEPAAYTPCRPSCRLCIQSCPAGALGGELVNQTACLSQAFRKVDGGQEILCWKCRQVCPNHLGTEH
jgi:epoxyqueuosine reductase QueG